jgi:endonuclease-8
VPEGDTIFRAARTLDRALGRKTVVAFESVFPALTRIHDDAPIIGRSVDGVRAVGKHLLMQFSGDLVLRTHMRMHGSWHIYKRGERWQRARKDMRIVVATADYEAVGFDVPVAEFITARDLARHEELTALGPDLLAPQFDVPDAVQRMREHPELTAAEALLNQRIVAGIGNVYKSEVLFASRIHPLTTIGDLDEVRLERVMTTARRLLLTNVSETAGGRRTTGLDDPRARLWVYDRARQPCRRCGTPIAISKDGLDARLTYWCPRCQVLRRV